MQVIFIASSSHSAGLAETPDIRDVGVQGKEGDEIRIQGAVSREDC
jgi:hypothetical protein